jgi:hypothetical protein
MAMEGPAIAEGLSFLKSLAQLGPLEADTTLGLAIRWLGKGYSEIAPGVFRSADGLRQFRMTVSDLLGRHGGGSHVNFELFTKTGVKNVHVPLK